MMRDSDNQISIKATIGFICLTALFLCSSRAHAQNINYSSLVPLSITKESDLNFGTVYQNEGRVTINLGNPGVGKFRIDGQKDMDVTVTATPPSQLTNVSNSNYYLPYTAEVAYANKGQDNPYQAQTFKLPTVTFRIGGRGTGPPGPPPTPSHGHYTPPTSSAWIYFYGYIQVQNVSTGSYNGTFDITVMYN